MTGCVGTCLAWVLGDGALALRWRCAGARDGIVGKLFLATDQTDDEWHCSSRVSRVSFLETGNRYP